ncbi:MAG TPA: glycosyltransferase [Terriglobia bacterium]|nr:glycosyltransferase [Terriglobia bacterium]
MGIARTGSAVCQSDLRASLSANPSSMGSIMREVVGGSDRPHILFLIDQLCHAGGAERALLQIIRLLPRSKFRCSLATFKINRRQPAFADIPCPVHIFPLRRTYGWSGLRAAVRLSKLIRTERVRLVHTFFETSDIWGGAVAKLSGCPRLISSRRDMGIFRSARHRVAYRLMNPLFDSVLTVSEEVRRAAIHEGLPASKVITVHNGIEAEKLMRARPGDGCELRNRLGLAEFPQVIATVANIRRVKGLDVLIRAMAIVREEYPGACLVVAGEILEPEYMRELQELIRDLDLAERVKFLGGSENVFALLRASDVFCLLSRSEGFSNALIEAMACGLPCVATRVGGNGEAVADGVSGFLVPPDDPEAAAHRILAVLRDPAKSRQMGRAGQLIVKTRFTAQAMIERLVDVYDHLLHSSGN